MVKRLLWLGAGLAIGALAVRAVTKQARKLTPGGIVDSVGRSVGGLTESIRSFVDDVRDGMSIREDEIHRAFAEGKRSMSRGPPGRAMSARRSTPATCSRSHRKVTHVDEDRGDQAPVLGPFRGERAYGRAQRAAAGH